MNKAGLMIKRTLSGAIVTAFMMTALTTPALAIVGQLYTSRVSGLRVHEGPSGDSPIVFKLDKGVRVIHKASSKGWWQIKTTDGKEGYVYRSYLQLASNPIKRNAVYRVYKISRLTVRRGPRSGSEKLGTFKRGTLVQLRNRRNDWGLIKHTNGNTGWVQLKFLEYVRG